ncbi:MAG TPA: glutamate--tRNA ligase [Allosphingosinicella sp.]|jgi:glutamyl-tRNA synthetase
MSDPFDLSALVAALFPGAVPTPEELARRYPSRSLPEGGMVTRIGPSPTGFMHIGTLYVGLLSHQFAEQSGGVSFLRIEDTDKKREVAGAIDFILRSFDHFGIEFDEGLNRDGVERGQYNPYTQSHRKPIYECFVRHLVEQGQAYPCFCSPEELDAIRREQQARGIPPGYYGEWAIWRHRPLADALAALSEGKPYVIRFRSSGDVERRIVAHDLLFGDREVPENNQDIVILKSDRLPTYHLAHVVDDHLMGTTHVIRGDEWLSSLPIHLQLFEALRWPAPVYAHVAPINKMDGGSRRKLSKRKDPEASVGYFIELGYPPEAVIDYLLNVANSNFEEWRKDHPNADFRAFPLSFGRLRGSSGPLFDFPKLDSISREKVALLSPAALYDHVLAWACEYDAELGALLSSDPDYGRRIFAIERDGEKTRKDIAKWSDVGESMEFFFDERFVLDLDTAVGLLAPLDAEEVRAIVAAFEIFYDQDDGRDKWFEKIKAIARARGFADKAGDYKRNPEAYKGTVSDVAKVFRVLLTGRTQTPDLHAVMRAMGRERVLARLAIAA